MLASSADWSLTMATGGNPVLLENSSSASSIFSQDGRHDIVILSHQIRVYFISTRQCVRTIDLDLSDVKDYKLDIANPNQILFFKENGEVITVNWREKTASSIVSSVQIDFNLPVLSIVSIQNDSFYIVTGKKDKKFLNTPHTRYIYRVDRESLTTQKLTEVSSVIKYTTSLDNKQLAFLTSNHEVILIGLSKVYKYIEQTHENTEKNNHVNDNTINPELIEIPKETIPFVYKSPCTALAVSNDSIIAIGTYSGAIQILYGGLVTGKPQRLLKWHIDQVRSLKFTPDNSYLISGGMEKVLVFWQLDTDKTQFLPRLNGTIEKIAIDGNKSDYYTLMLKVSSSDSAISENDGDNFECLVISSVDLVSRLSINSIRPKFSSNVAATLAKTKKKFQKSDADFDVAKVKHDYSSIFEIHPKTKNLYFPNEAVIQAYDLVKNEQSFLQNAAPVLATGKVRSESKLLDPSISLISFTQNGEWMCTFDSVSTSEVDKLLSKDDKQYALKFWKFIEVAPSANNKNETSINSKTGYWELSTKIIDPHGNLNPIKSLIPAPQSYSKGLAFLTADNKGGMRIWSPRISKEIYQSVQPNGKLQQTAWTLRKSKPCGALASDAVDICWSDDGSIIILAHECSISLYNATTFEEISNTFFQIPAISGSRIRSLQILESNLIILSKTRITSFNLLTNEVNELNAMVNTTIGSKNLIAIDPINKLICLAVNFYNTRNGEFNLNSKILIFKPDKLKPVYSCYHNKGISSIRYFNSSFIFIDLDSRVGIIKPNSSNLEEDKQFDLANDMNNMLINAQATANVISNRSVSVKSNNGKEKNIEIDESNEFNRIIDSNTFKPIFERAEGLSLEAIFDRIVKVIK